MAFCRNCGKQIEDGKECCAECMAKNTSSNNTAANDAVNAVKGILDTKDTSSQYIKDEIEKNKVICALAYFPILFWLPLVVGTKDSKYCKFHANQGLITLIFAVLVFIVSTLVSFIPIVNVIITTLLGLVQFAYFLFGFINTLLGKSKYLPFIGGIKILN